MNEPNALDLEGIVRRYGDLHILDRADLSVAPGEMVALLGPSGSGKSSLLHIAGLLERPSEGQVRIGGQDAGALSERQRTAMRRSEIGFVYQFHHLLPEFDARTNVSFPQRIGGTPRKAADRRSDALLSALGLSGRLDHQPAELSGGEKQRVAIARALANRPRLLLADEPTGNLDVDTSGRVFDALMEIVRAEGLAAIIATHDRQLAGRMDRVVSIEKKRIVPRTDLD